MAKKYILTDGQHHDEKGNIYNAAPPGLPGQPPASPTIVESEMQLDKVFACKFLPYYEPAGAVVAAPVVISQMDMTASFPGAADAGFQIFSVPGGFNIAEKETPTKSINPNPVDITAIMSFLSDHVKPPAK